MGLTDYLGKKRRLMIVKEVEFGVYLGNKDDKVLLPKKQVPKDVEVGDPVEVFLYKDSSDRLIATTQEPKITLDELAVLKVADTGRIGAFLDWGLEKDLLLPFKELTGIRKGYTDVHYIFDQVTLEKGKNKIKAVAVYNGKEYVDEIEWDYQSEKKRDADAHENKNEHAGW